MTESSTRILFLCTGNYYRSRYAEALFASWAPSPWQAASRGLWLGENRNPGPISRYTRRALSELALDYSELERPPRQVSDADFDQACRVIALDEDEHRPMIEARFPHRLTDIEFWRIPDIHLWEPERALSAIERQVRSLVDECASRDSRNIPQ